MRTIPRAESPWSTPACASLRRAKPRERGSGICQLAWPTTNRDPKGPIPARSRRSGIAPSGLDFDEIGSGGSLRSPPATRRRRFAAMCSMAMDAGRSKRAAPAHNSKLWGSEDVTTTDVFRFSPVYGASPAAGGYRPGLLALGVGVSDSLPPLCFCFQHALSVLTRRREEGLGPSAVAQARCAPAGRTCRPPKYRAGRIDMGNSHRLKPHEKHAEAC